MTNPAATLVCPLCGTYSMVASGRSTVVCSHCKWKMTLKESPMDGDETIRNIIRRIGPDETSIEVVRDLEKEGITTLKVKREPLPLPTLERTPRRTHELHTVEAAIDYIRRYGGERTVVLGDIQRMTIAITLDETQERGGRETLYLRPELHPEFSAWEGMTQNATRVSDFALFVLRHRSVVIEPDARHLAAVFSQIRVSKKVESRYAGVGKETVNGVMVTIKVGAGEETHPLDVPEIIVINTPIFINDEPETVSFDVIIDGRNDEPLIFLSAPDMIIRKLAAFGDMLDSILGTGGMPEGMVVGLGKPQTQCWDIVRG